ncbi:leucine-rich repeat flightless-interacting protein 2-like [Silurus asotus]|uniref:Leucine-rich repeat flightless-interacting protein 2-like n=1 Tax=Silurus asotus TaxID=30991 RepID=A0AAD5A184_SILAS|nr:leucine-rich repeat flightless-interacting protein 2-like [Silurus asotus]
MELKQNYEMCLAELQSVELRQEVLLFQVDCLQDALEGAEEMLIETKREAHQYSMELEHEREHRKKLQDTVALLIQELERIKEERVSVPHENIIQDQMEAVDLTDNPNPAVTVDECAPEDTQSVDASAQSTGSTTSLANFASAVYLLFKHKRAEQNSWRQAALQGTSVDEDARAARVVGSEEASLKESNQNAQDAEDYDESSGYEDAPSDFSPGSSTPDGPSDAALPEDGESELKNGNGARNLKEPEGCLLS